MYIAIEGCICAGKTTLAGLLAAERGSSLILEAFEDNPFLAEFYSDPAKYALETELAFLLIHFHETLHGLQQVRAGECVSDFHISKDPVFAEMNLDNESMPVFDNLYTALAHRLPPPDVVVCLQCSDGLILRRIDERQRHIEAQISPRYITTLNRLYNEYFRKITWPTVLVSVDEHDFVDDPSSVAWLSREIDKCLRA
jgi:deoxyguanosine kinase